MDQQRKERIARNQSRFREINERFGSAIFSCECGDLGCTTRMSVPRPVYESVRADPRRFLVKPDHRVPEAEELVVARDEWAVVRKRDDVAEIVEERDPRRAARSAS